MKLSSKTGLLQLSLFLSLLLTGASCYAFSPTGYPGAVWMYSGRDTSGIDGTNTQGFVRQGVEVLRLNGGQPLQVYGRYNWRLRNINKDYYNEYTPYVGTMLSFKYVDVGAEFGWPHYTGRSSSNKDRSLFTNWFRYWDLKEWRKADFIKALSLSTWGNVAYDLGSQNGSSTMGWAKLKADLFWLPHHFMAGPFAAYDWRLRSQNAAYFNLSEVSTGFEIGNDDVQLGAKYAWRHYPKLGQQDRGMECYITVFKAWDLKRAEPAKAR
jgi:hypothetical protein